MVPHSGVSVSDCRTVDYTVGQWITVGLSDCRTVGRCRTTVGLSDLCRTVEDSTGACHRSDYCRISVGLLSDCRTVGLSDNCRITVGLLSDYCRITVGLLSESTVGLSDRGSVSIGWGLYVCTHFSFAASDRYDMQPPSCIESRR